MLTLKLGFSDGGEGGPHHVVVIWLTLSFVVHEVLFGPSLLAFNFFPSSYCIFLMRDWLDGLDLACPQMMIDRSSVSMKGVWYIISKCVVRAIIITLSSPAAGGSLLSWLRPSVLTRFEMSAISISIWLPGTPLVIFNILPATLSSFKSCWAGELAEFS